MNSVYVVHNAKEDVDLDNDLWLVVDTTCGTAISRQDTREAAQADADVATAFYDRWPNGNPTESAYAPGGVDEHGNITMQVSPLLSPGYWRNYDFGQAGPNSSHG